MEYEQEYEWKVILISSTIQTTKELNSAAKEDWTPYLMSEKHILLWRHVQEEE